MASTEPAQTICLTSPTEIGEAEGVFTYAIALDDAVAGKVSWLQAMPLGTYNHPSYGKIQFTAENIARYADNVKNNVRGTELDIDYDHKDKTNEAAGWIKDAQARADGLWIAVEWTAAAAQKIKDKAYKYFSPEFASKWKHPKSGVEFKDVLFGGGITNRPFLKDILPINLSELGGIDLDPLDAIRTALGLPAGADAAAVVAAVTALQSDENAEEAPNDNGEGVDAVGTPTGVHMAPAMASEKLSEKDSLIAQLTDRLAIVETANRIAETSAQLTELNTGKSTAFSPVVLAEAKAVIATLPKDKGDKLIALMSKMLDKGIVQLGETAATNPRRTAEVGEDGAKLFTEAVEAITKDGKVSYGDAVLKVASENPAMYDAYRDAVYVREGAAK